MGDYWEQLRMQADSMLDRYGMKHCKAGITLTDLSPIYLWLIQETQLRGDYGFIRNLVKLCEYEVLHRLISESLQSLVKQSYFKLENNVFHYIA